MTKDGRNASQPYRARVGGIWYWVDPTVAHAIEPGDTVVIYPANNEPALAVLQSAATGDPVAFASLDGESFDMAARDIAALHLAAVDDDQSR